MPRDHSAPIAVEFGSKQHVGPHESGNRTGGVLLTQRQNTDARLKTRCARRLGQSRCERRSRQPPVFVPNAKTLVEWILRTNVAIYRDICQLRLSDNKDCTQNRSVSSISISFKLKVGAVKGNPVGTLLSILAWRGLQSAVPRRAS